MENLAPKGCPRRANMSRETGSICSIVVEIKTSVYLGPWLHSVLRAQMLNQVVCQCHLSLINLPIVCISLDWSQTEMNCSGDPAPRFINKKCRAINQSQDWLANKRANTSKVRSSVYCTAATHLTSSGMMSVMRRPFLGLLSGVCVCACFCFWALGCSAGISAQVQLLGQHLRPKPRQLKCLPSCS